MKLLIGVATMALAFSAQAQSWKVPSAVETNNRVETCRLIGEISLDNWRLKQAGKPMTPPDNSMATHWLWPLYRHAIMYPMYASSERDAYMQPASVCLDNLNRVASYYKRTGHPMSPDDLKW